jgi:hypothetical protein
MPKAQSGAATGYPSVADGAALAATPLNDFFENVPTLAPTDWEPAFNDWEPAFNDWEPAFNDWEPAFNDWGSSVQRLGASVER